MVASRRRPKGGFVAPFGLGIVAFMAVPNEIGWRYLTAMVTHQPAFGERAPTSAMATSAMATSAAPTNGLATRESPTSASPTGAARTNTVATVTFTAPAAARPAPGTVPAPTPRPEGYTLASVEPNTTG